MGWIIVAKWESCLHNNVFWNIWGFLNVFLTSNQSFIDESSILKCGLCRVPTSVVPFPKSFEK